MSAAELSRMADVLKRQRSAFTAALPELELPVFDQETKIATLAQAFAGLSLAKEAQALPLLESFRRRVQKEKVSWINEMAPTEIAWHSAKKLKLLYPEAPLDEENAPNSPELQVKLHECFGAKDHPFVCEGRLPVKVWLCSPDGKRIEPTFNWPAFKANTYPKLKAGLQKKFPGTLWV